MMMYGFKKRIKLPEMWPKSEIFLNLYIAKELLNNWFDISYITSYIKTYTCAIIKWISIEFIHYGALYIQNLGLKSNPQLLKINKKDPFSNNLTLYFIFVD